MSAQPHLTVVPLELDEANELVRRWHRHHEPVIGHKFSQAVVDERGEIRGAAITGRPTARGNQDGWTLEVVRVATDGCPNACSALYAAAWRATKGMGYKRLGTYTLVTEPGTSIRAAGWVVLYEVKGRSWDCPSRPRVDKHPTLDKFYWQPVESVVETIAEKLQSAWCAESSADPVRWTPDVPSHGQCAVTALVVQDKVGGILMRAKVDGASHYWNRVDGRNIDLTRDQFPPGARRGPAEERDREYVLSFPATARRYELLLERLERAA